VPLTRHNLRPKTDLRMRVKDQLQDLEEAHVEDVVGGEEDVVVVSDKMVQQKDLEVVGTPPRQNLPQHPPPPLQSQQLPAHLKAQETPEIDETEGATVVLPEAQQSRVEAYLQWDLDDNLVAG
jgi:hypothetical protein